jgi:predicted ATPase
MVVAPPLPPPWSTQRIARGSVALDVKQHGLSPRASNRDDERQAMSELAPGAIVAGHRIEAVVGRGGMGVVYRATQLALDRPVALKVIAPELVGDESARQRFVREARAAASFDHPNVVPVYDTGEEGEVAFIAMRYVPAADLRSLLRANGGLDAPRAAGIVAQVAGALDAAHAAGLVHRDVKPGNVLVDPENHVYLTDFGLAKHTLSTSGLTRSGHFVGTLDFVAPEQIRGEPVGAAADVYALGAVLYTALTGEVPFPRDSDEAKLYAHITAPAPKVSARLPDAPRGLDAVIERAMAKDPDERYTSAGELGRAAVAAAAGRRVTEPARRVVVADRERTDASTVSSPAAGVAAAPARRRVPVPPNRTIGRGDDVPALAERLRAGGVRLLTLTGPGGVGKTRLALETARAIQAEFRDGAQFVSLAAVRRPEEVAPAVVKALAIVVMSGESQPDALERFLAAKELLVVVDNFEHVLDAAPLIGGLLEACPELKVLATSRAPLRLQAEECFPVAPLGLPGPGTADNAPTLVAADAVALFAERARARDPAFEIGEDNAVAVADICRRVDGLPLAIELAAGRCGLLSAVEIANRLGDGLVDAATGARDAPARQRTLRATIEWSHELLSDAEAHAFARFAVFAGGATIEAVETITGATVETLEGLLAKSLLIRRQHAHAPSRLDMLETIRAYAAERFAGAEHETVRERHWRYYLAIAHRHGDERAIRGRSRNEHLARLDADIENLHAALGWAIGERAAEPALSLAVALGYYWATRNRQADAAVWLDRALGLPGADAHPALQVQALCFKVWTLRWLGRTADQPATLAEAETIARRLADPRILSQALQTHANCEAMAGHPAIADPIADEAISWATTAGDKWEVANAWNSKAMAAATAPELRRRVDRAAALLDEVGNVHLLSDVFISAAYTALFVGSDDDAKEFIDRAVPLARERDDPFIWMITRGNVGLAALLTGDTKAAEDAFLEELTLCRELVARPIASEGLIGLGAVAAVRGDTHRAGRLVGAASANRHGSQQDVIEARLEAAFFDEARQHCGRKAWDAAVREGAALSFEEAIAYALANPRGAYPSLP